MTKFDKHFWSAQYQNHKTGWDIGYVAPPIKEYIDQLHDKHISILIPGAGNAYEAEYLFRRGFTGVFVLDYAEEPIRNFLARVPGFPEEHIIREDFFAHKGQYDLIIEQTFFSSLPPGYRDKYARKMHRLLKKNGKLAGLLFQIDFPGDFPPFGGNKEAYNALFSKYFDIAVMETAYNSIKPRRSNELFFICIKK